MRIGMALPNHPYPPDIRVEKEAEVLAAAGHEVLLLCRGDGDSPRIEQVGPVKAVRHRVHPDSPLRRKIDSARFHATMDSPSWQRAMMSLVTEHGAHVLHLHDLPYAPSLLKAARATGVPAVLDLHENYPAAIAQWSRGRASRLFFSPSRAARLERHAVRDADRVIVVVDEAKQRLVSLGGDRDRITVFGNTEPLRLAPHDPSPPDFSKGLRIVYVGGLAPHRGLDTAIAAMPMVLKSDPDASLRIVGAGESLSPLQAQAAELGIEHAVVFTGRLPKSEAMDSVSWANVALVPHRRSAHTDSTIPHKLFQYMALGRPVVVSDCAPLARIVRETDSGRVFKSGDPVDLAGKVLEVADPTTGKALGMAGREAVLVRWNLEAEAPRLTELYDELGADTARPRSAHR